MTELQLQFGLTISLLQWFALSLMVGDEWFLMFLSRKDGDLSS